MPEWSHHLLRLSTMAKQLQKIRHQQLQHHPEPDCGTKAFPNFSIPRSAQIGLGAVIATTGYISLVHTQFAHLHPRLSIALVVASSLLLLAAIYGCSLTHKKRGRLRRPDLRLTSYLNHSFEQNYPVLVDRAWDSLVDGLRSHTVKTPDTRTAHWEPISVNSADKIARFAVTYTRVTLGTKVARLYPRTIECTVHMLGTGSSTIVDVQYHAQSTMDYQIVSQLVEQTNRQIERTLTSNACKCERAS